MSYQPLYMWMFVSFWFSVCISIIHGRTHAYTHTPWTCALYLKLRRIYTDCLVFLCIIYHRTTCQKPTKSGAFNVNLNKSYKQVLHRISHGCVSSSTLINISNIWKVMANIYWIKQRERLKVTRQFSQI